MSGVKAVQAAPSPTSPDEPGSASTEIEVKFQADRPALERVLAARKMLSDGSALETNRVT